MPNHTKGLYLAFLTALISGVSNFVNKFAVASFETPVMLPAIRNSLVGLLLLGSLVTFGKREKSLSEVRALTKKQLLQLVGVAIIGGALPFYLFFTGLSQIPAVNASIIHKSLVFWVVLLAIPLLKEKLTKTQALAVLMLFAGNLMIGGFRGLSFSTGEFMVLSATLLWAVETVVIKKLLVSINPDLIATTRMGLGSLLLLITSAIISPAGFTQLATLTSTQWFWISLTSIMLFGYVSFWYRALKYTPAISVSAILVSATLVTNILSAIFITHAWHPILTYQGMLIFVGVLLFIFSLLKLSLRKRGTFTPVS